MPRRPLLPARLTMLLFMGTLVAVSYLALTPTPPRAADLGWDKLNHFSAFGALTVLGVQAFGRARERLATGLLAMGLLAYGGLIELLQTQVPGRSAEWADLLADGIGIALGLVGLAVVDRLSARRPH